MGFGDILCDSVFIVSQAINVVVCRDYLVRLK